MALLYSDENARSLSVVRVASLKVLKMLKVRGSKCRFLGSKCKAQRRKGDLYDAEDEYMKPAITK